MPRKLIFCKNLRVECACLPALRLEGRVWACMSSSPKMPSFSPLLCCCGWDSETTFLHRQHQPMRALREGAGLKGRVIGLVPPCLLYVPAAPFHPAARDPSHSNRIHLQFSSPIELASGALSQRLQLHTGSISYTSGPERQPHGASLPAKLTNWNY